MISFTLNELIGTIITICGCITAVAGALAVIMNWYKKAKAPEVEQNKQIEELRERLDTDEKILSEVTTSLDEIKESNRIIQRAMLASLSHGLNGNNITEMEDAKKELYNYLLEK